MNLCTNNVVFYQIPELVGISFRLSCFLCFIQRFWNHVLTCVSVNPSADANSTLSGVDKYLRKIKSNYDVFTFRTLLNHWKIITYLWASNRFSSPVNCGSLKTVLAFLRRQCRSALIPIPRISGIPWQPLPWNPAKIPVNSHEKIWWKIK